MVKEKLIVIEGLDGCGKSTVARKVAEEIPYTRLSKEPTDYDIGKLIRNYLKQSDLDDEKSEGMRDGLLFFADRIEHHRKFIMPSMKEGYNVVTSRNEYSTLAYQVAQEIDPMILIKIREYLIQNDIILRPDISIIIDIDPKVAYQRKINMGESLEKFENIGRQIKVRDNYQQMGCFFHRDNIHYISGEDAKDVVFENVMKVIEK